MTRPQPLVIPLDELDPSPHSQRLHELRAGELLLVAIHGAPRLQTEWLAGDDPTWRSKAQ